MKRISKEIFCNGDYETAVAIRIENGEFAFLGDMEEWSDSPDWNIPGRRIFAPYKYLALDRVLVSEGILDAMEAPEYELTPMVYYFETEEECSNKTNRNVKDFLLADNDRLNLLGLKLEAEIFETEMKDVVNKLIESFDVREYRICCNNVDVHTAKLARAQYADIRDIVYNKIPVNRDIYDVNGEQIKISDIVDISERRIA